MLESELPNYDIVSNTKENTNNENIENNNENNDENNSVNNNELAKIIIEEQKYFIDNWSKYILTIGQNIFYQNLIQIYLNLGILSKKFPRDIRIF